MARKTSRFAQDCNLLEKDLEKSTPEKIVVKGHSDAVDSVLYAFKESPAYAYTPPIKGPKYGSPEWAILEAEQMRQKNFEHVQAEQKQLMDDFDPFLQQAHEFDLNRWKG